MNIPEWNKRIKELADAVRDKPVIRGSQTNRVAVLIEPRNHPVVYDLLTWTIYLLAPEGWKFIIYCGNLNIYNVSHLINTSGVQDIVELRNLGKNNLTIPEYSKMLVSSAFWTSIPYENILIFQSDSVLLDGKLDEFLWYDYVGSPWNDYCIYFYQVSHSVGNGGLSLRRRSGMLRAINVSTNLRIPYSTKKVAERYQAMNADEDMFFCKCRAKYLNFPSKEVAMKFGVEGIYADSPKGYHKPWFYLPENVMNLVYERIDRKRDSLLPLVEKPTVSKTN